MNTDRKYKIFTQLKLVIIHSEGRIDFQEMKQFMDHLKDDPEYDISFNSIVDLRNSKAAPDMKQMELFMKNLFKAEFMTERKDVFITNTPDHVILPYLLKQKSEELPLKIQVTSSLEAAVDFLELNEDDLLLLKKSFSELKSNSEPYEDFKLPP